MYEEEFKLRYLDIMMFWKAGIFEDMYLHQQMWNVVSVGLIVL